MISRRTFLKASAAASGLILPSWLVHAEKFIELEGKPYLEKPANHQLTLYAARTGNKLGYELFLGDPREDSGLDLTWQEFIDAYDMGQEEFDYLVDFEGDSLTLQDKVDEERILYHWEYPSAKAYNFLEGKDLGPDFGASDGVGSIDFYEGFSPANDCQVVAASDELLLSLFYYRSGLTK